MKISDANSFTMIKLCVDVVKETIRRHFHAFGVHIGFPNVRNSAVISVDERVSVYMDWILRLRVTGVVTKFMCSLHSTLPSNCSSKPTTLCGSARKHSARSKTTRYTKCILTGLLSDGRQLKSILYT